MISILRSFIKSIPTLILSFALAVAVWISAVSASDPVEQRVYPRPITIERTGQSPSLVISSEMPDQVSVTLRAPGSVWDRLLNDKNPIRAWLNLSGLEAGTYTLEVKVQPQVQPAKLINYSPKTVTFTLEELVTKAFPVDLVQLGTPEVGFQVDTPSLGEKMVTITGPASLVAQVSKVQLTINVNQAKENINRRLPVAVFSDDDKPVEGITISPAEILVTQPISQRGGYRNVVIKVATSGQVAGGYRLTNISVFPPNVTVFSTNPALVDRLPGFVETFPLDLTGVKDDLEVRLSLNLPNGIEVVGDQALLVQVGVAAIEGSITLADLPIRLQGLSPDLSARISPEKVDVIISGPVPLLDVLKNSDVRVLLDMSSATEGTYQFAPKVEILVPELKVESILPSSIEVIVEERILTPTLTPSKTATPTPKR